MKLHKRHAIVLVPVLAALAVVSYAVAAGSSGKFDESLSGSEEPPYVSTTGNGTFEAELSNDGTSISYRLSYADLEGASIQQAHIHVGQKLSTEASPSSCARTSATAGGHPGLSGGAGNDHRNDHRSQRDRAGWPGDPGGAFAELVQAMKAGATYVNVHTSMAPGGEIRAQLHDNDDGNDD